MPSSWFSLKVCAIPTIIIKKKYIYMSTVRVCCMACIATKRDIPCLRRTCLALSQLFNKSHQFLHGRQNTFHPSFSESLSSLRNPGVACPLWICYRDLLKILGWLRNIFLTSIDVPVLFWIVLEKTQLNKIIKCNFLFLENRILFPKSLSASEKWHTWVCCHSCAACYKENLVSYNGLSGFSKLCLVEAW